MPDNGVYISELTNTTNVTDDTLFITDDTENTYNIKASDVASYVSGKVLPEAESYSDDNKTAAVAEAKEYTDSVAYGPNLLINSNFLAPVNQRGFSSADLNSATKYTIDRWWALGGKGSPKCTLKNTGINISLVTFGNGNFARISQSFSEENYAALKGKTLTLSGKIVELTGELLLYYYNGNTHTLIETITEAGDFEVFFTVPETITGFGIMVQVTAANANCTLEYLKLEIGNKATKYIPKKYEEELLECYRYFYKLNTTNTGIPSLGTAVMRTETLCLPALWLPTAMRAVPTIDYSGFQALIDSSIVAINSIAIQACAGQNMSLRITLSENSTIGKAVFIQGTNSGENNLTLDAEIYS